jgi:hypothetical protein
VQTVKAVKALAGYQEGDVFSVDEGSAAVLKERGDVEFVTDEAPEAGGLGVRATTRRSGVAITQVAEADYPEQPAADTESGPTKSSNKADLVAFAATQGLADESGNVYSEAELEALSKADLVAKLKLG